MSSCKILTISPCCQPAQVIADEYCANINVDNIQANPPGYGLWSTLEENKPQDAVFTISLNPDSDSAGNVTIIVSNAPNITFVIQPGQSRTDVIPNALHYGITSVSSVARATGKMCSTTYRKFK